MAQMNRRLFLRAGAAALMGCSAAASPLLTTVTLAGGAPMLGDHRLVVVILRGGLDGLDMVQPVADPLFSTYRPGLTRTPGLPLDGIFALNARLAGLMPLWKAGELAFVHATSTPYRDKRSHFDGQDILEAGTGLDVPMPEVRDGWLNRMLQAIPGLGAETAYAVGREALPLLAGAAPVRSWVPDQRLRLSDTSRALLERVYHDDPLFHAAAMEAMDLADEMDGTGGMAEGMTRPPKARGGRQADAEALASFAAGRLQDAARIAAFSLSGWDSHGNQASSLVQSYAALEALLLRLRADLGPVWGKTAVLAMTEFGRTARENGTGGTDHGTGGAMLMAGGAIRGGRIYGDWPGLEEAALYDRRDLMPTSDVRGWAAWALHGLFGLDRSVLETAVFPGLDMGSDPRFLA
ncbi:hypothetical protein GCM10011452_15380 [Gemmobacter lanyuensis]|uniref:Twin-arginine translocation pathway signal n=1 Tax=Gemmobacter lanyuensis TaxID=1054497 RepID=A0A918IRT4_9RHOB|nr:DUF1501 domain-containing protein [Gemmobacter lanyuensis]GGW27738.1 hypothetical protein GCM10011452_15380 [Gemmobacter lanyuensis]